VCSEVSVFKFLSPLFSMVWGAAFLGEALAVPDLVGMVLILFSSAVVILSQPQSREEVEFARDGNQRHFRHE